MLECGPEKECHPATCCEVKKKKAPNGHAGHEAKPMDSKDDTELELVTVVESSSSGK